MVSNKPIIEKVQWLIDQNDRGRGEYTSVLKSVLKDLNNEVPKTIKKTKKPKRSPNP